MLRSYELLRDNDPIREHYQRRFRHILIDEFQDTNKLQYAWIKMLAAPPGEGAAAPCGRRGVRRGRRRPEHLRLSRRARGQHGRLRARVRACSTRSSWSRTTAASATSWTRPTQLISHNSKRLGKNLRTDQGPGEPVRVYEATSDFAEAQWMVDEMKQLVREGMSRKEIAVLYRSNAQSRVIETALFNAGMPYRVYGGLRFFERAEIKHALAYLRLLENPNDDTSFMRVVNFPPRGIGARSIEQLQDVARAAGCSLHDAVSAVTGQGRRQPRRLCRQARRAARADAGPDPARDHRAGAASTAAWSSTTRPSAKAQTGSRTWRNWSTRPRASSASKASAAMRWRCRWMSWRQPDAEPGQPGAGPERCRCWTSLPRARRRNRRDPVAAGGLPDARRAGVRRQPGAGRAGRGAADDGARRPRGWSSTACSSPAWKRACSRTRTR